MSEGTLLEESPLGHRVGSRGTNPSLPTVASTLIVQASRGHYPGMKVWVARQELFGLFIEHLLCAQARAAAGLQRDHGLQGKLTLSTCGSQYTKASGSRQSGTTRCPWVPQRPGFW